MDQKERLSTAGQVEHTVGPRLVPQGIVPTIWGLQAAVARPTTSAQMDELGLRSKLEPFKKFERMLRSHLDGVLAWTKTRLSNGAVEGMNNKIKSISHRSFGFRSAENFIAAIYHCCARLPLPPEA